MAPVVQNSSKAKQEFSPLRHRSSTLHRHQIQAMIMNAIEAAELWRARFNGVGIVGSAGI